MRAQRRTGTFAVLAFALLAGACRDEGGAPRNQVAAARVDLRPGLWEVSREVVSAAQPGLPHEISERMKARRTVRRHCITPTQAAHPETSFVAAPARAQCSRREFAMAGGTIAGAFRCRDATGADTVARIAGRYGADRFEYRTEIETPGLGGQTMRVVTLQSGRRIGQCPASDEGETTR